LNCSNKKKEKEREVKKKKKHRQKTKHEVESFCTLLVVSDGKSTWFFWYLGAMEKIKK
jgi:hypothetical protein